MGVQPPSGAMGLPASQGPQEPNIPQLAQMLKGSIQDFAALIQGVSEHPHKADQESFMTQFQKSILEVYQLSAQAMKVS